MRVVTVSATDTRGGAGIAAYRLHTALRKSGVDAIMMAQERGSDDASVLLHKTCFGRYGVLVRKLLDRLPWWLLGPRNAILFSTAWIPSRRLVREINALRPDIVHLHWVCGGMLRIEDIMRINAPIIWTMHDLWPMSNGSHYDVALHGVLPEWQEIRKRSVYAQVQSLTMVGPSNWITHKAATSVLRDTCTQVHTPNCINVEQFKPSGKHRARSQFGLPLHAQLVLFGAVSPTSDPNKGYKELKAALAQLSNDVELVVFGAESGVKIGLPVHYMGTIVDAEKIALLYSSADVMVVPSRQENLSNVIMESLACGTPVVAFDIGGNGDMVEHRQNGYLAQPFDTQDLARGIQWVLEHNQGGVLGRAAREKVEQTFAEDVVVPQYTALYKEVAH